MWGRHRRQGKEAMLQKYIQYLRFIGLGKGRIFLHILIHVLDGVREFVVNIFAVSFYISCLQEGDGKRFFAGLLFFCGINLALRGVSRWYRECYSEQSDIFAGRADCTPAFRDGTDGSNLRHGAWTDYRVRQPSGTFGTKGALPLPPAASPSAGSSRSAPPYG